MPSIRLSAETFEQRVVEFLGYVNTGVYVAHYAPGGRRTHWELSALKQIRLNRAEISLAMGRPLTDEQWRLLRAGVGDDSRIQEVSEDEFLVVPRAG